MRRYFLDESVCVEMLIINFQFGDGIMSMIDCKVKVDKKPDPKGDRVVLTFEYVSDVYSCLLFYNH